MSDRCFHLSQKSAEKKKGLVINKIPPGRWHWASNYSFLSLPGQPPIPIWFSKDCDWAWSIFVPSQCPGQGMTPIRFVEHSQASYFWEAKSLYQHKYWLLPQNASVLRLGLLWRPNLWFTMFWVKHYPYAVDSMMSSVSGPVGIQKVLNTGDFLFKLYACNSNLYHEVTGLHKPYQN